MKKFLFVVVAVVVGTLCVPSQAQQAMNAPGLSVGIGYTHITQDFGLNGFNVEAAYRFSRIVAATADFDAGFKTSTLGTFGAASGSAVKSRIQDYMIGPRFFFPGVFKNGRLEPFGELEFGITHLSSTITAPNQPNSESSDNAFSWLFGGGLAYQLSPAWALRGNLDLLRTHFANQGQSRARLVIGVWYHLGR